MENTTKKFKVLALDGGGIRGYYIAIILQKIEKTFNIKLNNFFDLLIGTSTGSIIASCIALETPIDEVVKLYQDKGKKIFKRKRFGMGLFKSKYKKDDLISILKTQFNDKKLGEITKPLMIVSSDLLNDNVYIHKSDYLSKIGRSYTRDKETKIVDAILSSCSAPTYFNPQRLDNGYFLCDGGLWANNPSILGFTEAISKFQKNKSDVFILSIGSGNNKISYVKKGKCWGILTGWGRGKLIEYLLSLSSKGSTNISRLLLEENYLRVNSDVGYNLDNINDIENLKSYAEKCFLDNENKIKEFLNKMRS